MEREVINYGNYGALNSPSARVKCSVTVIEAEADGQTKVRSVFLLHNGTRSPVIRGESRSKSAEDAESDSEKRRATRRLANRSGSSMHSDSCPAWRATPSLDPDCPARDRAGPPRDTRSPNDGQDPKLNRLAGCARQAASGVENPATSLARSTWRQPPVFSNKRPTWVLIVEAATPSAAATSGMPPISTIAISTRSSIGVR
jgi:hypothetical protein